MARFKLTDRARGRARSRRRAAVGVAATTECPPGYKWLQGADGVWRCKAMGKCPPGYKWLQGADGVWRCKAEPTHAPSTGAAPLVRRPGFSAGSSMAYAPSTAAPAPAKPLPSWLTFETGWWDEPGAGPGLAAEPAAAGTFEPEIYWICQDADGKQYRC